MIEKNKALLIEFIEKVWNKGDLQAADEFIEPPYIIEPVAY